MALHYLRLENFRSVRKLEIDFRAIDGSTRGWTFLLGENGTGKSSILRAIALLTCGSKALPHLLGQPDSWIRNTARMARISGVLATHDGEPREIHLEIRRGQDATEAMTANLENLRLLDDALKHTVRSYLTLGYGVSRRLSPYANSIPTPADSRARGVLTLFQPDAGLIAIEEWAIDLHYRFGRKGLQTIKDTLNSLLPQCQFHSIDRRNKCLIFQTPDGLVPLRQLSDGYQNVASWVGDLVYRVTDIFQDYKDPLKARGVLLIDEIDLHLHPVWQRSLRAYLSEKLPNLQIITTTHSPLTAQLAGDGELFFLKRERKSVKLLPFHGDPSKLMVHQLLLSPLFGLPTPDSPAVESMRAEYGGLARKKRKSELESARYAELKDELRQLPQWTEKTPADHGQFELLREIRAELSARR